MAWVIERAKSCIDCGTQMEEWDPKKGGHRQAYTVRSWYCPGCSLMRGTYKSTTKDNPHMEGLHVRLEPTSFHPYRRPRPDPGRLGR